MCGLHRATVQNDDLQCEVRLGQRQGVSPAIRSTLTEGLRSPEYDNYRLRRSADTVADTFTLLAQVLDSPG